MKKMKKKKKNVSYTQIFKVYLISNMIKTVSHCKTLINGGRIKFTQGCKYNNYFNKRDETPMSYFYNVFHYISELKLIY